MHLRYRNVNDAFAGFAQLFCRGRAGGPGGAATTRRETRTGSVEAVGEPVLVTYTHPAERVLLNPARGWNPFHALYEGLWMLAGRRDVAPLAYYNPRMAEFSDDGTTLNGAYGFRWRHHYASAGDLCDGRDQIETLVRHLTAEPNSRRAVLQMWTVADDLVKAGESKDVCCNLSVMFALREVAENPTALLDENNPSCRGPVATARRYLDMTVVSRSNDLVWGLLGGDYVHFTMLQEYLAARLGARVGVYHHLANNLHAYVGREDWKPEAWLAADRGVGSYKVTSSRMTIPLVQDPRRFERELPEFVERHGRGGIAGDYGEPFLREVAQKACVAYHYANREEYDVASSVAESIKAGDWQAVCVRWIERRAVSRQRGV